MSLRNQKGGHGMIGGDTENPIVIINGKEYISSDSCQNHATVATSYVKQQYDLPTDDTIPPVAPEAPEETGATGATEEPNAKAHLMNSVLGIAETVLGTNVTVNTHPEALRKSRPRTIESGTPGARPRSPSSSPSKSPKSPKSPKKIKATNMEIAIKIIDNCKNTVEQLEKCKKALKKFFKDKEIDQLDQEALLQKLEKRIEEAKLAQAPVAPGASKSRSRSPSVASGAPKASGAPRAPNASGAPRASKQNRPNSPKRISPVTKALGNSSEKPKNPSKQKRREKYQLIGSEEEEEFYMKKYLKYKQKYLELKEMLNQ